ncbi:MAG: hypothetical protein KF716_11550 [Anaerolineae bacterium]|nr:hypothetical protein [Anaerolineae bacterium]
MIQRIRHVYVSFAAAFVMLLGAIVPVRFAAIASTPRVNYLFTNADGTSCERPCLFGIRPGRMGFRTAVQLLAKHPLIYDMDASVCTRVSGFCTFRVRLYGARGAIVAMEAIKDKEFVVQDVYLAFEHTPDSPMLGDFIGALGTDMVMIPHYVDVNNATNTTNPTCCSTSDLDFAVEKLNRFSTHGFTLYYPQQGIEVTDFADFKGANYALTPHSTISGLRVFLPYPVCSATKFYWNHWLGFHTIQEYYAVPATSCNQS